MCFFDAGLRKDIAKLQTELSAAKLQEFEAQEQLTQLFIDLEKERAARIEAEEKLKVSIFRSRKQNSECFLYAMQTYD